MSRTGHSRYRRNRARIRNEDICWLCGGWIDPQYKSPHPLSWTADHVTPVHQGGHNNGLLRPSHRACNQARNRKQRPHAQHGRTW